MRVLAMTVCTVDTYPQYDLERLGGNSLNFAVQAKCSGIEHVAMLGAVGTDDNGTRVINTLSSLGVDTSHLYQVEGTTANNKLYVTKEGERYAHDEDWDGGVYQAFRPTEVDWAFAQTHNIVAIPILDPNLDEALNRLKGCHIVIDGLHLKDVALVEKILPHIDVLFSGTDAEFVETLQPVSQRVDKPLVVTLGAEGSLCLYRGESFFQPVLAVDRVVDTTGCGDAYQAAFTLDWFQHKNISQAMLAGAEAATEVLTHYGGVIYSFL
jgi:fructoselysine 6-kinase